MEIDEQGAFVITEDKKVLVQSDPPELGVEVKVNLVFVEDAHLTIRSEH